jgi:hypothetical protein
MLPRLAAASLALTALAAVSACESSGRYGSPAHAAAAVGAGVAGAAVSRAAGGCLAQCLAGTTCNPATGLCDRVAHVAPAPVSPKASGHPPLVATASYEPGHVYEVPAVSTEGVACDPATEGDGGAVWCEMDASAPR